MSLYILSEPLGLLGPGNAVWQSGIGKLVRGGCILVVRVSMRCREGWVDEIAWRALQCGVCCILCVVVVGRGGRLHG